MDKRVLPDVIQHMDQAIESLFESEEFCKKLSYVTDVQCFERWLQTEVGYAISREHYTNGRANRYWAYPEVNDRTDLSIYTGHDNSQKQLHALVEMKALFNTEKMWREGPGRVRKDEAKLANKRQSSKFADKSCLLLVASVLQRYTTSFSYPAVLAIKDIDELSTHFLSGVADQVKSRHGIRHFDVIPQWEQWGTWPEIRPLWRVRISRVWLS